MLNKKTISYKDIIGKPIEEKNFGERLLERATHYRDFEIKASLERSKYFALFLGALFIAYYTMKQHDSFSHWMFLLITGLGTIISFVWYFVNRGSKMIYENWEHHIDFIEQEYCLGNISHVHCWKNFNKYKPTDVYPISPSKANSLVSFLISISFLILFLYEIFDSCKNFLNYSYETYICCECVFLFILCLGLVYLPVLLQSSSFSQFNKVQQINIRNRISGKEYMSLYTEKDKPELI